MAEIIMQGECHMYTVYLVEDEPLVLKDMKSVIPWAEHDLIVTGCNTSSAQALEEIPRLKPEVVFTDICMPEMNGLDLIASLREKGSDCEFVVISAHEDFRYAKQVIQLQGFDYLVKPVEEAQYSELLTHLLKRLEQKLPHRNLPATPSDELNKILLFLNRNLHTKYSLKDISSRFNVGTTYLCTLFSKYLNTTFSAYNTDIRMKHAQHLLISTGKPVKEIALACGYEDYFYFCRVFRDYHGCTPTQLREQAVVRS